MISDIRNLQTGFTPAARPAAAHSASTESAEPKEGFTRSSLNSVTPRLADVLSATAAEARSLAPKLQEHVEGELLVKLKPELSLDGPESFLNEYGARLIEEIDLPASIYKSTSDELLHVKLPAGVSTAEGMAALSKDARVAYAEPNDILHVIDAQEQPSEPAALDGRLWGMNNTGQNGGKDDVDIDAPEAWQITTGSRQGPVIAVIDTGIDYTHKTLSNNVWTNPADGTHGYNAITGANDPADDHYHGTHCAGTIAGNGTDGVYGVNHEAQVMGVKFLSANGGGTLADAIKGIVFATEHGARITSNSWGGGGYNQALKDALASSPALHIFAAGNESNNNDASPAYPASYDLPNIVSVAAMDRNERLANFSNYGKTTVDVAAPGVDIYSTAPGNKYKNLSGTSMATPHVSGIAGLIATAYPDATNEQIKARLLNSVDPVAAFADKMSTGGRVNAAAALKNDSVAPYTPANFSVTEAKAGRVSLGWLASGDDGISGGKAGGYQVVYSDKPIVDGPAGEGQVSFSDARPVATGKPGEPGSAEGVAIDLPLTGQAKTYYFAMKVSDKVGNVSAMTSTWAQVPAAKLAFEDNDNPANWTADGSWAQVDVEGRGKVWTDSPNGEYASNANTAITSRAISLEGVSGAKLIFDEKHATENRYDKLNVEASADGQTWSSLANYSGSGDWATRTLDLSAFDGQSVQLRFRLTSDGSVNGDGVYIDNVAIAGGDA